MAGPVSTTGGKANGPFPPLCTKFLKKMMLRLESCKKGGLLIRLGQECEDRFKGSVCLESCVAFIFNLFKDVSMSAISEHLVVLFPLSVFNLELLQISTKMPSFQTQMRISRRL